MPDDNSSAPNPASVAAPTLPTVADAGVPANAGVPEVANVPETPSVPTSDAVVTPEVPVAGVTNAGATDTAPITDTETPAEVARKIGEAHNVLVALSSDPSVDEMAAAIGLSLYLDKLGKRATAIYSGQTPNALEFLKPEETFEDSVDTLQDFVIALNKEKADHLRYKLDGDYVKIYITPYKSKIAEEDLEFSYGDYNVDLVLALDVANGVDLDAALREHGRIMHDAVIINITTGNPGKLGEIEWSDKKASSVSEMIATLLYNANSKVKIDKEEATAFLTGIVAATNRFSNAGTTPETMKLASRLMESGANQQLVSKNITPDIENELFGGLPGMASETKVDNDPTKLDIEHGNEHDVDESKVVNGTVTEKESTLLDDLKAAEASLAAAGAETTPETGNEPLKIDSAVDSATLPEVANEVTAEANHDADMMNAGIVDSENTSTENPSSDFISDKPEKVIQPLGDLGSLNSVADGEADKYGQMLEDALATADNPAIANAPTVTANPEINGVPEINYMPMPGEEVLPPPPAPPIDMDAPVPTEATAPDATPVAASVASTTPVVSEPATPAASEPAVQPAVAQPVMQDQVYTPQAVDPSAFKIPGT